MAGGAFRCRHPSGGLGTWDEILLSRLIGAFFIVALPARADSAAYAHCGTYDSYILLYKSTQKFEELGSCDAAKRLTLWRGTTTILKCGPRTAGSDG